VKVKLIVFLFIGVSCAAAGLFFYWDEFSLIFTHPQNFFDKLLTAGGFLNTTLFVLILNVSIALISLFIELIIVGWDKSALKRIVGLKDRSTIGDVMCWALSIVGLYDFIAFISTFGLFYLISSVIHSTLFIGIGQSMGNDIILFAIIFILSDFKHYLWHWTMHKLAPFWEVHKYHHSATSMNLITNSRGHFLGKGIAMIFDALLFALIGAPPLLYAGLYIWREIWAMWLHADVRFPLGWMGRYILMTPQLHKVHHSTEVTHYDKNFGTFFVFWDRIFGTFHEEDTVEAIGIENDPYNKSGFWKDMLLGFKLFTKAIMPRKFGS
jgi:sterol desaturase/sphingolipid hydroxylase (fatty acid hydroxylase superfamily)